MNVVRLESVQTLNLSEDFDVLEVAQCCTEEVESR